MRRVVPVLVTLLIAAPAFAQEQVGCDKFKWPLERERALLTQAPVAKSGGEIALGAAVKLTLVPVVEAKLPVPPSRTPKSGSYAGIIQISALPATGTYRVTLTANAWVDVVQDGQIVPSGEFTGAGGCEGLRKSVKFKLNSKPAIIELTGMETSEIGVAITPD